MGAQHMFAVLAHSEKGRSGWAGHGAHVGRVVAGVVLLSGRVVCSDEGVGVQHNAANGDLHRAHTTCYALICFHAVKSW